MPKLTDRFLSALTVEPGKKDRLVFDTECRGLGVRLTVAGTRAFVVQWTDPATRQKRREALGVWGGITIEQAREAARARLGDVAKGIDPRAVRLAQRDTAERERAERALTLKALVDDWASLHLAHKRPRYAAEAVRALTFAFADHLRRPASRLSKAEVVAVLDALLKAGRAAMAGRTLAYGRACYAWAEKRGKVPGNPFAGVPIGAGVVARERVLSGDEVGRVWNAALGMGEPWGPLFRVLLLTLARREEVAGMRWSELSADLSTWTIPGTRMKRGQAHVVALPEAAREALRAVRRIKGQDLVFSTTGTTTVSGFTKAKQTLDKAAKVTGWRLHDIRRTGVSTLAAMGFNPVVADMLLAHQPGRLSTVARVYQRHDFAAEREAALRAWAEQVLRCGSGGNRDAANVADLMAHRAGRQHG
ncbi:tyrosine-type recombinase/integrase [Elioraea sp.]|uniref:tyrosine-type recombinase/integrase n=1 Tax=Elioraea sp. TaxID=2185103 RepID=UPI003F6EFAB0